MAESLEKSKGDYLHSATKAGLSVVPIVGGALATVFETVFSTPIDKRKEEWLKRLSKTIDDLCERVEGLTPEKLSNNPEFISVYLQASNIALRTHNNEKLEALNSAVNNSVILNDLGESKKMIFLRIIDQMSPLHLALLQFMVDPSHLKNKAESSLPKNTYQQWPNLGSIWDEINKDALSDSPIVSLAVKDLYSYGLIMVDSMSKAFVKTSAGTGLGKEFIHFVSNET